MPPGALPGRVDQIAFIVPDLEAAMDAYIAKLGVTFGVFEANESMSAFSGSSSRFRIRIAVALAGLLSIELIQPVSGVTLYSKHLDAHGGGLHHLGVYVDNLAKARKLFAGPEYPCVLEGSIRGLGKFAYFEAPDLHCVFELLQLSLSFPLFLAKNAQWYSVRPALGPIRARDRRSQP
jgi:catechol 2,3-dioxygenase-like lactoylglutathione lyase family enzyme